MKNVLIVDVDKKVLDFLCIHGIIYIYQINQRSKMIPVILHKIINLVKLSNFNLTKKHVDGRINSVFNEIDIIDLIQSKFNIIIPDVRSWFDIAVKDDVTNTILYINIKCTNINKKNNDNISSKKGLFYSLTGKSNLNINTWDLFIKNLKNNIKNTSSDYYFLVIDKENISNSYVTSMKHLSTLISNGNNLPFQSNWNTNQLLIERSFNQYKEFVLSALKTSLKLRAKAYFCWCDNME